MHYQTVVKKALLDYETFFEGPEFIPLKCQLYSELLVRAAELSSHIQNEKSVSHKNIHPPRQWCNQVGARGALRPPWMHFGLILGKFVDENALI